MKCTTGLAEVYRFYYQGDICTFFIDSQPRQYTLCINSTYGNGYSYCWSDPGMSFKEFLVKRDEGYLTGKMVPDQDVFDPHKTGQELKKQILKWRRAGEMTAEDAAEEWDLARNLGREEISYEQWVDGSSLDAHDFWQGGPSANHLQFRGLYRCFWPVFIEKLKEELADDARLDFSKA